MPICELSTPFYARSGSAYVVALPERLSHVVIRLERSGRDDNSKKAGRQSPKDGSHKGQAEKPQARNEN